MTMNKITREYVAASVNRYPNVCDWGEKLIAFGSCHSVCIFDVGEHKILEILMKHTGEVRSVKWVVPDEVLVSAAASKDAIIWRKIKGETLFTPLYHLKDHSSALFVAESLLLPDKKTFVTVTGDTDFKLSVFVNQDKTHEVKLKHFVFDAKLIIGPETFCQHILVAFASDDCLLHLGFMNKTSFTIDKIIDFSGHSDWIRSLDFVFDQQCLFVATASQDNFVRVTKITRTTEGIKAEINKKVFSHENEWFEASLETVLPGHDGPVYCVRWINRSYIMTASLDKSVVIWKDNGSDDVWTEVLRVGEIGGNNMGFFGCCFPSSAKNCDDLLPVFSAYSYNGSLHFWLKNNKTEAWESKTGFGGHYQEVTDISWDPEGNYLMSASNDETTRLHSLCQRETGKSSWHETARPQIHGYLINCITSIDHLTFASGADEKVIRVFQATKSFFQSEVALTGRQIVDPSLEQSLALGSDVPALGLTNRAVYDKPQVISEDGDATSECVRILKEPPQEETLMQHTLWPEIHKLYGHGNELFAVACNHKKTLLASACKSSKADQAAIILWDIKDDYKITQRLPGHSLTVTSIEFSPCDQFLVSVSRDRTWFLYRQKQEDPVVYEEVAFTNKSTCIHSRIIWDVSWTPDSRFFLTVSRDKKAILWEVKVTADGIVVEPLKDHTLSVEHALMSCDVYDSFIGSEKSILCCFGLEDGSVILYTWNSKDSWKQIDFSETEETHLLKHHLPVRKVRFRSSKTSKSICFASCSDDRSVQVYSLFLK